LDATHAKTNQHCRAEDCLASIWNNLPQEFTDKAILSFRKKLRSLRFCVAAAAADTLNTQFKYRDGSWHSLLKRLKYFTKKLCKVWFVI